MRLRLIYIIPAGLGLALFATYAIPQVVPSPGPPTGIACAYNTAPVTLTNGQAGWVQCDDVGSVIVSPSSGSFNNASVSATAAAVPASATYIGVTDGGTLRGAPGDATNGIWVNVKSATGIAQGSTTSGSTFSPIGGAARTSEPTAVTNGQNVQLIADLVGKLIVLPYANPENFVSGVISSAMTGTTTTSLIAAPAAGLRNYITQITCSNGHATVGTDILIQDGSGGTTIYLLPAAALFGGAAITFPTPLRQPTTATAIFVANVTTGASTKCAASGYKGA